METSLIAWYAAILSTIVFTWDMTKWWRAEPRLSVSAKPNVAYMDGEVVETEQQPDGTAVKTLASYCHVEIVNTGGRPTTLIAVAAVSGRKGGARPPMSMSATNYKSHRGSEQLPVKLGPGEMWSARFDMRQLEGLRHIGSIYIEVRAAYRNAPVRVRVLKSKPA